MKPEIFEASIERGSNQLYVKSDRTVAVRNGAFIKLGMNDIFYKTESTQSLNIKKRFTCSGDSLVIKGNYNYKLAENDNCSITFDEYEAIEISKIGQSSTRYKIGEKIYAQGGITSSSSGNLTGEQTQVEITKVGETGQVIKAKINKPGLYVLPPENPVQIMNEDGKTIEMDLEFDLASNVSILERDFTDIEGSESETRIRITYPLPKGIKKGEFIVSKQVIFLDKEYSHESLEGEICQITYDYSPINGIPLMPPNSIDPQTTYNAGIAIIDKKLLELDKRLTRMENMNY